MLQNLREHVQGWIAGVIASILGLAFALWGVEYYLSNGPAQVIVAKVNGAEITQSQLDIAYNRARQSLQISDPAMNELFQKQIKARALNGLIQERVLVTAAERAGYSISLAQVGAIVQQIPAFQLNGQFSYELFQRALLNLAYTPEVFSQEIAKSNLLKQAQQGMVESNFALADDLNRQLLLNNQQRDFGYVAIPPGAFLATVSVANTAVENYYQAHSQDYINPPQLRLQYLLLSATDIAKKKSISEQELRQYYEDNKATFAPPSQWQVARILIRLDQNADAKTQAAQETKIQQLADQLKAGHTFAEVAKAHSQDQLSAAAGGLLGWLTRAQQPALIKIVSALQPGQVSAPFRTNEGFNLVKLVAVKNPPAADFITVKAQVEKNLRQQKIDQWIADQSDKLANLTYTHPDTLKPAADALNLPIQTTAFFGQTGEKTGLLANPKILNAAFSDNILKQHNNSDVIALDEQTLLVIRLADYKPAAAQPLSQVRASIEKTLKQQAAQQAAMAVGEKIAQALKKGTTASQLAAQNKLMWLEKKAVNRVTKDIPPSILALAFNQPVPANGKPSILTKALSDGSYVVMALRAVREGPLTPLNATASAALAKQLSNDFGTLDYDLYVAQKMRVAKIKMIAAS